MAASKSVRPIPGFTKFNASANEGIPSGIILQDENGNDWYLFVDEDGKLYVADAETAEAAYATSQFGGTVPAGGIVELIGEQTS